MIDTVLSYGLLGVICTALVFAIWKLGKLAWAEVKAFALAFIADMKEREIKAAEQAEKQQDKIIGLVKDWNDQHEELVNKVVETLNKNTQVIQSLKELIQFNKFKTDP